MIVTISANKHNVHLLIKRFFSNFLSRKAVLRALSWRYNFHYIRIILDTPGRPCKEQFV